MAADFQKLDQDWRLLAYRLTQNRDTDRTTGEYVRRASEYNQRLDSLFQITPQINGRELARQCTVMAENVRNLVEDVEIEVTDPSKRYAIQNKAQTAYSQIRRTSQLISRQASYEQVRDEYLRFRELWRPVVRDLRSLRSRHMERQLRRVKHVDHQIEELLWLKPQLDRDGLLHTTALLQRDADQMMDGITLRMLMQLPASRDQIVNSASEFYTLCGDFNECVTNGDDTDTLADIYGYMQTDWNRLNGFVGELEHPPTRQNLVEINNSVTELRDILGVRPDFDRRRATDVAAQVIGLADHYDHDVRGELQELGNRYPRNQRSELLRSSTEFNNAAKRVHAGIVNGSPLQQLRNDSIQLSQVWQTFSRNTARLPSDQQDHLQRIRQRISPLLVDLQAMLQL